MQIPVSHGHLEASLREPDLDPRAAAVLCHPHPLHGGTMHTKAVFRAAQALNEVGVRVLRFNFRGVGTSTGSYADGVGEEEDVEAALRYVEAESPGLPLILGGFSFGSLVGSRVALREPGIRSLLLMGVPISIYDFGHLRDLERPTVVVQADGDELGPGAEVERVVGGLGRHITVERIPESNHYFDGAFDGLKEAVGRFFTDGPGGRALAREAATTSSRGQEEDRA